MLRHRILRENIQNIRWVFPRKCGKGWEHRWDGDSGSWGMPGHPRPGDSGGTFPGVTSAGLEPHILLKRAFIRKKLLGGCCGMLRWECGDNAEPQERGAGSGGDIGGVIKKRS